MFAGRPRGWIYRTLASAVGTAALLATVALTLNGCSANFGGGGSSVSSQQALGTLPWCDQPQISFVDSTSSSQQAITQWSQVKDQLGFTPYFPTTLPKGSCLDLLGGAIHDPIFGGHLSVTWVLPGTGPISFSEAPRRGDVAATPQCTQSSQTASATTICIGAIDNTNVTIASHLTADQLKAYFGQLKPGKTWEPATTSK